MQAWNPSVTATFYFNAILMGTLLTIQLLLEARWQISGSVGTALSDIFGNERNFFLNHAILSQTIHAFFRRLSLDACNSSAQRKKNCWIGSGSLVFINTFHSEVNSVFSPAGGQRGSPGLIGSMPNVCLTDVLCRMFEKCLRWWWSTFVLAALWKYRLALLWVGQQGSNIQMWRKHESFVQYLAHYCEIHVATK